LGQQGFAGDAANPGSNIGETIGQYAGCKIWQQEAVQCEYYRGINLMNQTTGCGLLEWLLSGSSDPTNHSASRLHLANETTQTIAHDRAGGRNHIAMVEASLTPQKKG
jgi:hypothetical protein